MQYLRSLGSTNNDAQFRRDTDHPFVLGFVDIRKCFHWSNSFSAACRVTVLSVFADGNSYSIVNPYVCYVWFSLYTPSSNDTLCFVLTLGEFDILLLGLTKVKFINMNLFKSKFADLSLKKKAFAPMRTRLSSKLLCYFIL